VWAYVIHYVRCINVSLDQQQYLSVSHSHADSERDVTAAAAAACICTAAQGRRQVKKCGVD